MSVNPSVASSFIKFDQIENKIVILKDAITEYEGEFVILLKLSAYTPGKYPVLRETTRFFMLDVKQNWSPPVLAVAESFTPAGNGKTKAFLKTTNKSGKIVIGFSRDMVLRQALP